MQFLWAKLCAQNNTLKSIQVRAVLPRTDVSSSFQGSPKLIFPLRWEGQTLDQTYQWRITGRKDRGSLMKQNVILTKRGPGYAGTHFGSQ